MTRFVTVRILFERTAAEARSAPYEGLVTHPRVAARPHESLVVEADGDERTRQAVDLADIEVERRRAVLALGRKTIDDLDRGGGDVGFAPSARAQRHERV